MWPILFPVLRWIPYGVGAIAALLLASGPLIFYGKHLGKREASVDAMANSLRVLKKRNQIDEDIDRIDLASLCASMGLPDSEYEECVRRLEQADPQG